MGTGAVTTAEEARAFDQSLGEFLVRHGKLDGAGLERARRLSESQGERVDRVLTKLGLVSEHDMAEAIAAELDLPLARAADFPDAPVLQGKVSIRFLRESRILPLADTPQGLVLAMADPTDSYATEAMRIIAGKPVAANVATPTDIDNALDRIYGGESSIEQIVEEIGAHDAQASDDDVERLKDLASEAPVIRLVNALIGKAVEARASDVHLEPFENRLRVRYRIDGVLREVEAPPNRFRAAMVSRIKIMARLNIAEQRLPQDGRLRLAVRGNEIDLRVSTVPTMHGESVVMRILDRAGVVLDFPSLGFRDDGLEVYLGVLERPDGILLVTGPTGSGKTTTLYTSLLRLNTPEKKILTVEDPIEYQLDGVNQIQVKPRIELSFANALRSILRQDPDVIMIGEIRDLETAKIAVQAALTGHVVLSTLHTNNAASAVTRLLDMGVEDYLITSTVNGIVGQRLVRTLCRHCREPYRALPELIKQLELDRFAAEGTITLYRAKGCDQCEGTGYSGRTGIVETLVMSDPIRRLVLDHAEANELQRAAVEEGMRTMYADGIAKALAGDTTLEEVLRVTRDA